MVGGALDRVLAQRLATQRLTGPASPDPVGVVRELLCVQAQDAPLARWSIGQRSTASEAEVRAAIDDGRILRTHVLRPTWHYLAAEDLRWLLRLTSPKVLTGLAGRHRQLGIEPPALREARRVLVEELSGRRPLTRRALAQALIARGLVREGDPLTGQQVGHLLLVAELEGLICSGPMQGWEHSYLLVDEVVPPTRPLDRPAAVRTLVRRFFAGHGPVAVRDLTRWTRLTMTEIAAAVAELGDDLQTDVVAGTELWHAPAAVQQTTRRHDTLLVSTFDEIVLTYRFAGFPRADGHPAGEDVYRFAETGGGIVLDRLRDAGSWRRTAKGTRWLIDVRLADAAGHRWPAIAEAAESMAGWFGATAVLNRR